MIKRMLSKKKGYLGNPNLKAVGEQQDFTQEQVEEYIKCRDDLVYFVTKYMRIINVDRGLIPFDLYDYQIKLIKTIEGERFVVVKFPRQSGKSSTLCAYALHYILFNSNVTIGILANKETTAKEILGRIKKAYELLPKWLQQGVQEWNKKSVELENGSKVVAAATSASSIRGLSMNCVTGDTQVTIRENGIVKTVPIESLIDIGMQTRPISPTRECGFNPIHNKYYRIYNELMKKGKLRESDSSIVGYYELHHVIPRSLGGTDDPENLVSLTAREHFLAHRLLMKFLHGKEKAKMVFACHRMITGHQKKYLKLTSRQYEALRLEYSKSCSLLYTGRTHSDETKQKISDAHKGRSLSPETIDKIKNSHYHQNHPRGYKQSEEFCKNLSEKLKGRTKSKEHVDKINKNPDKIRKMAEKHRGMIRGPEARANMSAARKGCIAQNIGMKWCYSPSTGERKYVRPDVTLEEGFVFGYGPRKPKTD